MVVTDGRVKLEVVAPGRTPPFLRHWKVGAGLPEAAAVNVTVAPAFTFWLMGCVVMAGAGLG